MPCQSMDERRNPLNIQHKLLSLLLQHTKKIHCQTSHLLQHNHLSSGKKWYHSQWLRTNTSLFTCTEDHQDCRTSWKTHHNWRCHRWRWWVWKSSSESKTTIPKKEHPWKRTPTQKIQNSIFTTTSSSRTIRKSLAGPTQQQHYTMWRWISHDTIPPWKTTCDKATPDGNSYCLQTTPTWNTTISTARNCCHKPARKPDWIPVTDDQQCTFNNCTINFKM